MKRHSTEAGCVILSCAVSNLSRILFNLFRPVLPIVKKTYACFPNRIETTLKVDFKSIDLFRRIMHVMKTFQEHVFPVGFPGTPGHSVPANFLQRSRVWDFWIRESWVADSQLTGNQLQFLESAGAWGFFNFCEIVCGFDQSAICQLSEQIIMGWWSLPCILPLKINSFWLISW